NYRPQLSGEALDLAERHRQRREVRRAGRAHLVEDRLHARGARRRVGEPLRQSPRAAGVEHLLEHGAMLAREPLAQMGPRERSPAIVGLERLDLLADPVEAQVRAELEVDARELARIEAPLLGELHDLEDLRRERERRYAARDRLRQAE